MYQQFYGLKRSPFEISPDPEFYCATHFHDEGWASLMYGVQQRKGIALLTGEVGTGKTLLLHCLMRWLRKEHISFGYIVNSRLSTIEFLQYFVSHLEMPFAGKTKAELLIQLNRYLLNRHRQGFTTVLIVDEGHLLDWDVLEEIRLLSNLETMQAKLLQIIVVGQLELEQRLESAELRHLKQRIVLRSRLEPLSEQQTRAYVARRLEIAGAGSREGSLFPEDTMIAIMRYSRGIPRLINTICDNALLTGYARQIRSITPEIIDQVAADARLNLAPKLEPVHSQPEVISF